MNLTFSKAILAGTVTVTATVSGYSTADTNLMASYGEPEVDLGGEFYLPASTPLPGPPPGSTPLPTSTPVPGPAPVYVHSNVKRKINTDFSNAVKPLQVIFDGGNIGPEKAMADANVWIATMRLRFQQALEELRALPIGFDQSESTQI